MAWEQVVVEISVDFRLHAFLFDRLWLRCIDYDLDRVIRIDGFGLVHAVSGFYIVPIGMFAFLGLFILSERTGQDAVLSGFQIIEI